MIITRTPLRISLGGGGTDLPSYYQRYGGSLVAAAINKYVYISINRTFTNDYFLKYSAMERVESIDSIEHGIIREAFRSHELGPAIELVSVADMPSGTGLGSSGTFTVGLLRAIYAHKHRHVTSGNLAIEACDIEIGRLRQPVGKQDQYIAAYGGLTCFDFQPDGGVHVSPLMVTNETLRDLEEHLLLFFTGYSRNASKMLADQQSRSEKDDSAMLDSLHVAKELGIESRKALEAGDTVRFGTLMDEHWRHKRKRSPGMSNRNIDRWYRVAMDSGAVGGKLVGAGAGGFLMFYAQEPLRVRKAMASEGLADVPFNFDHDGSVVLVRN